MFEFFRLIFDSSKRNGSIKNHGQQWPEWQLQAKLKRAPDQAPALAKHSKNK